MSLNPSEQRFFSMIEAQRANAPAIPLSQLTIEEFRTKNKFFLDYMGKPADVAYSESNIIVRDGYAVPIRVYDPNPHCKLPVLIYYQANGYFVDLLEVNGVICSRIAKYAGIKVIIVSSRLTPEVSFPIPINDAYDATIYIVKHAEELNILSEKIFIGGICSGAHCAALITNKIAKQGIFKIAGQILLNGSYNLTHGNNEYAEFERVDQLITRRMSEVLYKYYGITQVDLTNPELSPYFETELSQLPPTTILVAEYDGLRSDSEAYYLKLKDADVPVKKILLPGQTHNTALLRGVITDGDDPAEVMAEALRKWC